MIIVVVLVDDDNHNYDDDDHHYFIITYIIITMMMMMMMMVTPRKTGIMATITESKKAATHPCEHTPRQSPKPDFKRNPVKACCYFFRFGSVPKRCIKTH